MPRDAQPNLGEVRNQRIGRIFQGPWEQTKGVDMPGLAGPTWEYADLFLEIDEGRSLRIVCGATGIVDDLPHGAQRVDDDLRGLEHNRSIVDVFQSEDEPQILVLLDDGRHIEYSLQPGGSHWEVDRLDSSWAEETEDGRQETFISLVDGKAIDWVDLVRWHNDGLRKRSSGA